MKILQITSGWTTHAQFISDDAKADAAFVALRGAIDSYDKYGNDKDKSVTVDTGSGQHTFRVDSLTAVSIDCCALAEADLIEREIWKRTMDAKVAAALMPLKSAAPF